MTKQPLVTLTWGGATALKISLKKYGNVVVVGYRTNANSTSPWHFRKCAYGAIIRLEHPFFMSLWTKHVTVLDSVHQGVDKAVR